MYQGVGRPGESERRSWRNSLPVLADDLREAGLGGRPGAPGASPAADEQACGRRPRGGSPEDGSPLVRRRRAQAVEPGTAVGGTATTLLDVDGARYRPVAAPERSRSTATSTTCVTSSSVLSSDAGVDHRRGLPAQRVEELGIDDLRGSPRPVIASRLFTGQKRGRPPRLPAVAAGARLRRPRGRRTALVPHRTVEAAAVASRPTRSSSASSSCCSTSSGSPTSSCSPRCARRRTRTPRPWSSSPVARERQERHRAVTARRAGARGPHRHARDRFPLVHADPARGRR